MTLTQLMELARKADQNKWSVVEYGDGDSLVIHSNDVDRVCFMATHGGSKKSWEIIQANAAFIAAANPSRIMVMLRVCEAARNYSVIEDPSAAMLAFNDLEQAIAALDKEMAP